ncbi:MAG: hypothetical protein MZU95_10175 [Desulfomicrobium escambiense]|nr:hypothetical protein [Desulfomicrobium escambiense]
MISVARTPRRRIRLAASVRFREGERACFESARASEKQVAALAADIDKVTDYYDTIRMYQYPVDGPTRRFNTQGKQVAARSSQGLVRKGLMLEYMPALFLQPKYSR